MFGLFGKVGLGCTVAGLGAAELGLVRLGLAWFPNKDSGLCVCAAGVHEHAPLDICIQ